MFKVIVALAAVLLFLPVISGQIALTVYCSALVVFIGLALCCMGLLANYRYPRLASFAIGGWTISCIVLLAIMSVVAAWEVIHLKDDSPAAASTDVKTFAALAAAATSAVLAWLLGGRWWLTGGGLAKRYLKKEFTTLFPAQPQAPPQGIEAWQGVDYAFFHANEKDWRLRFRCTLFRTVKAAIDADGYKSGSAWRDAELPTSGPKIVDHKHT